MGPVVSLFTRTCVVCRSGQACIAFHKGKYAQARELYANVISENPQCPAAVRVGLGMCLFKLGHIYAAKKAFLRALQLDVRYTHTHLHTR